MYLPAALALGGFDGFLLGGGGGRGGGENKDCWESGSRWGFRVVIQGSSCSRSGGTDVIAVRVNTSTLDHGSAWCFAVGPLGVARGSEELTLRYIFAGMSLGSGTVNTFGDLHRCPARI